ncbi:MAG: type IX secretion system membrane protein PorP/SprF [Bacteroidota bacterium]
MRKIFLATTLFCLFSVADAQQLHFMSQYMQHNSMYNPAAAGVSQNNQIGLAYRSQWSSFPGHPTTTMLYGDFELKKYTSGIAAYLYRDETGPTSRSGVQLAYSYHIKARNDKSRFAIGLELRGLQYAIDKTKLTDALGNNDPVLAGAESKFAFDAGAGVYWTNKKLSVGAAVSQLIESKLALSDVPNATTNGKLYRHYNFSANYKIQTGDDIYIIPNAMVRVIENSPSEYDFGAKVDYQDKVWWDLDWRVNQSWSIQAGLKILQKIRINYSYDIYTSPISVFDGGSGAHEISLQFDLKKK